MIGELCEFDIRLFWYCYLLRFKYFKAQCDSRTLGEDLDSNFKSFTASWAVMHIKKYFILMIIVYMSNIPYVIIA